jgi:hypothetical protein
VTFRRYSLIGETSHDENVARLNDELERWWFAVSTTSEARPPSLLARYEYKVIDTGKDVERELNELGAEGWQVVGVTTKKQMMIAPPQAIILMREVQ